jgi:hypothetical protein
MRDDPSGVAGFADVVVIDASLLVATRRNRLRRPCDRHAYVITAGNLI